MPFVPFIIDVGTVNTWFVGMIGWACFLGWLIASAEAPTKKEARLGLLLLALYTIFFLIFGMWLYLTALWLVALAILGFVIYFIAKAFWRMISIAFNGETRQDSR